MINSFILLMNINSNIHVFFILNKYLQYTSNKENERDLAFILLLLNFSIQGLFYFIIYNFMTSMRFKVIFIFIFPIHKTNLKLIV
jgi:hypothetical protein